MTRILSGPHVSSREGSESASLRAVSLRHASLTPTALSSNSSFALPDLSTQPCHRPSPRNSIGRPFEVRNGANLRVCAFTYIIRPGQIRLRHCSCFPRCRMCLQQKSVLNVLV
ncbi:hypothetical protein HYPSUDRAFT_68205 [Hypholoma sublateritium FD-334 SS-4]|uniref:Uncharacterized protein n=1 Tax=Hypholoma sublateritium (strain FD-334 SS-4) TaxID=945553 RepID=A0A0D2L2F7_HYPSF|nr:hypothetical protein HYPSUDRAFT_68205 [Hypholoma sublateritium FD-334 SS-4]